MRKKLTAIIATVLAAVLTLSVAGCGKKSGITIAVPNTPHERPCNTLCLGYVSALEVIYILSDQTFLVQCYASISRYNSLVSLRYLSSLCV